MNQSVFFYILISFFCTGLISCKQAQNKNQDSKEDVSLTKAWKTPDTLNIPESVLFDSTKKLLYVSNINGKPTQKDGNGFISSLSLDGEILEYKLVEGLSAPKGMAISNGHLYVTDIDELVKINLKNYKIVDKYPVKEARFLNDVTSNSGNVYFSDMHTNKVHVLKNDVISTLLEDPRLSTTNGLFYYKDELYIGTNGIIFKFNIENNTLYPFIEDTDPVDGLVHYENEAFLFSNWKGKVFLGWTDSIITLIDKEAQGINAADIEFVKNKNMLLIPTFSDNRVVAYYLN
jgi:DNA-binding beta-propeller fold protein YncE